MTAFVTKYVQDLFHVFVKKYTMIIISFKKYAGFAFYNTTLGVCKGMLPCAARKWQDKPSKREKNNVTKAKWGNDKDSQTTPRYREIETPKPITLFEYMHNIQCTCIFITNVQSGLDTI